MTLNGNRKQYLRASHLELLSLEEWVFAVVAALKISTKSLHDTSKALVALLYNASIYRTTVEILENIHW